ncbi:MAG: hypothetical protein SFV55_00225 [Haliscomenobacter sp.]|uniref:hypothetical protein n=1 Tax=Haliscomenobacter sp. TaxID=2717303 RepID=UPI0029BCF0FA|nr:hypothetical protein [Haliscomenobacter sp.]MDX2066812.1 hypothetical protein [Haliscomenobacter sp.]
MDNLEPNPNQQSWFEQLEKESWSAELIISGAAIYGSLQLPWLLTKMVNYSLLNFGDEILQILYLFFTYLTFAITILMINFILHFILRSIWVGLLGLSSVYPHGVNEESENYSRHYLKQLKADFGDLRSYAARVDQTCSIIFAFSFSVAMIFTSIASIVLALAVIAYGVHQLLSQFPINTIFFVMLSSLLVPGIIGAVLNTKRLRDKTWVQKIHYPLIVKSSSRIIFNFLYQPVFYINSTFITNLNKRAYTFGMVGYILLVLPAFIVVFLQSNVMYTNQQYYFSNADREDRFYSVHYEDHLKADRLIQNPIIPSSEITGSGIKLFLPLPTREEVVLNKKYGEYQKDSTLNDSQNLLRSRAWFKEQGKKYFHIELNGRKFVPDQLRSYNHHNANEYGFLAYIPDSLLLSGENLIYIQSEYRYEGKKRESFIPFWYSAK